MNASGIQEIFVEGKTPAEAGEFAIVSRPGRSSWCGTAGRLAELLGVEAVFKPDTPQDILAMLGGEAGLAWVDVPATAERAGYTCQLGEDGIYRLKLKPIEGEALCPKPLGSVLPKGYRLTGSYTLGIPGAPGLSVYQLTSEAQLKAQERRGENNKGRRLSDYAGDYAGKGEV